MTGKRDSNLYRMIFMISLVLFGWDIFCFFLKLLIWWMWYIIIFNKFCWWWVKAPKLKIGLSGWIIIKKEEWKKEMFMLKWLFFWICPFWRVKIRGTARKKISTPMRVPHILLNTLFCQINLSREWIFPVQDVHFALILWYAAKIIPTL